MILERTIAAHLQTAIPGLIAFKDDLAWAQAGSPYPYLMVTVTGSGRKPLGTGRYDDKRWEEGPREWVFEKTWIYPKAVRFTVRGKAIAGKSGATVVAETVKAIEAELRKYGSGQRLVLTDPVSEANVIIRRVKYRGASDQSPNLQRVPFDAQQTLDYELQELEVIEVSREKDFQTIDVIQE